MQIFISVRSGHHIGSRMFFKLLKGKSIGFGKKYSSFGAARYANILKASFQGIQEGKGEPKV